MTGERFIAGEGVPGTEPSHFRYFGYWDGSHWWRAGDNMFRGVPGEGFRFDGAYAWFKLVASERFLTGEDILR